MIATSLPRAVAPVLALVLALVSAPLPAQSDPLARGAQLRKEKKWIQAAELYRGLTREDALDGRAWFLLGNSQLQGGQPDAALPALMLAVSLAPDYEAEAAADIARVYIAAGDGPRSLQWLQRAVASGFEGMRSLRREPAFKELAREPGFKELLRGKGSVAAAGEAEVAGGIAAGPQAFRVDLGGRVETIERGLGGAAGGLAVGAAGMLFVADGDETVWRLAPGVDPEPWASDLGAPSNCLVGPDGALYVAEFARGRVLRISDRNKIEVYCAAGMSGPVGMVFDAKGQLYVANCRDESITRIEPDRRSFRFSRSDLYNCPHGLAFGDRGRLFVGNHGDGRILEVDSRGLAREYAVVPGGRIGHLAWAHDALWVAAQDAQQIYRVERGGRLVLVAGTGSGGRSDGDALAAELLRPHGLAFSADAAVLYWTEHLQNPDEARRKGEGFALRRLLLPEIR